jgi:hypothetical protein
MSGLFSNLGKSLRDIFTSKKFLVGVMTGIVQLLPISDDLRHSILGIGGAVILGQAASDFGKNAKAKPPGDAK